MKTSRIFSLVFRYGILVGVGYSIVFLWKVCHLAYYEPWGMFLSVWIPIVYAVFSTGYMVFVEYCPFSSPDPRMTINNPFIRFFNYDDYTYLFLLWIIGLEIAAPYLKNVYLWFFISYLALVIGKTMLFLIAFFRYVRQISGQHHHPTHVPRYIQTTLLLTAFLAYSLISAYHVQRTTTTGDEPHYLLITHSLWHDRDTNLYNNYTNRDYESFYWGELRPTWGDEVSETEIYSYRHKGGFPHTLIPGYIIGGRLGVILQMNLITALLMLQVFLLSYELFSSLSASFATWICMTFTIPFIIYMGQIYPEPLAALLMVWTVRQIRMLHLKNSLRDKRFWRNCLLIVLSLLLLVFLKTRYLPLVGTLVVFLIFRLFQAYIHTKHKMQIVAGLGVALLVGAIGVLFVDSFFFDNMFRDRITDTKYMVWMLGGYNPLYGLLGLMFDQEYGLLIYTPLYLLAFVGVGLLTRKELRDTVPILAIFSLNYFVIALWPLWHAAPTPPSRYILPILPLLGVFLARFFLQKSFLRKVIILGVCGIWSFLAVWVVTLVPWWRYNWADGTNNFLEWLSLRLSIHLPKIFPSWIRVSPATPYLTFLGIFWIGAILYIYRVEIQKSSRVLRDLSPELHVLLTLTLFLSIFWGGLVIGKILPISVLEAEDMLDVQADGGERIPATLDPWDNQQYLRRWKYYGWKLNPGERLNVHPKLYYSLPSSKVGETLEWELQIYARATFDKENSADKPVMLVLMNNKEVGKVTVSSMDWKPYTFPLVVDEKRPHLEISHQNPLDSQCALIIDKLRFH